MRRCRLANLDKTFFLANSFSLKENAIFLAHLELSDYQHLFFRISIPSFHFRKSKKIIKHKSYPKVATEATTIKAALMPMLLTSAKVAISIKTITFYLLKVHPKQTILAALPYTPATSVLFSLTSKTYLPKKTYICTYKAKLSYA